MCHILWQSDVETFSSEAQMWTAQWHQMTSEGITNQLDSSSGNVSIHPIIVEIFQRWLNCLSINRWIDNGNNLLAVLHLRTCGNAVKQRENSDWLPLLCCNWRIQLGWLLKQRVKRKKSHWWEQGQIDKLYRTYRDIISFIYDDDLVFGKTLGEKHH